MQRLRTMHLFAGAIDNDANRRIVFAWIRKRAENVGQRNQSLIFIGQTVLRSLGVKPVPRLTRKTFTRKTRNEQWCGQESGGRSTQTRYLFTGKKIDRGLIYMSCERSTASMKQRRSGLFLKMALIAQSVAHRLMQKPKGILTIAMQQAGFVIFCVGGAILCLAW